MNTNSISTNPSFHFLDIHISEINNYSNALQDIIVNRRFAGMIIRELFSKDCMEQVVSRLEKNENDINSLFMTSKQITELYWKSPLMAKTSHLFGSGLLISKPDLKDYFADASVCREKCRALFQGNPDYEDRVESVLHTLSSGLPVKVPTGAEGQTYNSVTIRVLPDGHEYQLHVGNNFLFTPQAHHLRTLIDPTDQLSFFIPLTLPEAGGELVVYTLDWEAEQRETNKDPDYSEVQKRNRNVNIDQYKSIALTPNVGDMILFDGGRYYHRVTPVIGSRPRITIGGFLSYSCDHDAIYYWN